MSDDSTYAHRMAAGCLEQSHKNFNVWDKHSGAARKGTETRPPCNYSLICAVKVSCIAGTQLFLWRSDLNYDLYEMSLRAFAQNV